MRVSVVVPTYNRAVLVGRLLDSLAQQTLSPLAFEVIVVDDGSTDGTAAVLERAAQAVCHLCVVRQANQGPARARNAGLACARGDIVAFIDSDCIAGTRWLAALVEALDADATLAGAEGRTVTDRALVGPFTHQVENLRGGVYATCNVAYRRQVLEALGGFDADFFYGHEDTELALRAMRHGRIAFVHDAVVTHPPTPVGFVSSVLAMRVTVDNERILYLKTRDRYRQLHGCGPVWTLLWRIGVAQARAGLAFHARAMLGAPWTGARYVCSLAMQRVILLAMLPGFVLGVCRGALPSARGQPAGAQAVAQ